MSGLIKITSICLALLVLMFVGYRTMRQTAAVAPPDEISIDMDGCATLDALLLKNKREYKEALNVAVKNVSKYPPMTMETSKRAMTMETARRAMAIETVKRAKYYASLTDPFIKEINESEHRTNCKTLGPEFFRTNFRAIRRNFDTMNGPPATLILKPEH
jgi:hypothetical protein